MFYDARNFLTNIQHENTLTPAILADYTYGYDLAGNRTSMTDVSGGVTTNITWDYDAANRLIEEHNDRNDIGFTTEYQYDQNGNRTREIRANGDIIRYSYNNNDQLTSIQHPDYITESYEYDARGNLDTVTQKQGITTLGTTNYTFDARNQLTSVTSGIDTLGTFSYDYAGRRTQMNDGTLTTDYLWDEFSAYGDVVLETNVAGTTAYTLANGTLISQTVDTGTPVTSYFLTDAIGSTRMMTDGTGQIAGSFEYDAFGNLLGEPDVQTLGTDYLYAGQQFDPMTELYSMRARYYDSSVGRFMSRDVYPYDFGNPVELNRYAYVANNPVNHIDPSGYALEGFVAQLKAAIRVKVGGAIFGAGVGAMTGAFIGGLHAALIWNWTSANHCGDRVNEAGQSREDFIRGGIVSGALYGAGVGAGLGAGGIWKIAAGTVLTGMGFIGAVSSGVEGLGDYLEGNGLNRCAALDGALSVMAMFFGIKAMRSGFAEVSKYRAEAREALELQRVRQELLQILNQVQQIYEALRLGKDLHEGLTGARLQQILNIRLEPTATQGRGDFINPSNNITYDAVTPKGQFFTQQWANGNIQNSIQVVHRLNFKAHITVVDVSDLTPSQSSQVITFVNSLTWPAGPGLPDVMIIDGFTRIR